MTSDMIFVAKSLFCLMFPHYYAHRLVFSPAAGVPLVSVLRAAPGPVGGLLLLSPRLLLLLLPRLRPLLCGRPGGASGGAQLPRPLPLGPVRVLLRANRVSGVLSGVLRDLPPQLAGSC